MLRSMMQVFVKKQHGSSGTLPKGFLMLNSYALTLMAAGYMHSELNAYGQILAVSGNF